MRRLTEVPLIFVSFLLIISGCSNNQEIVIEPWEILLTDLKYAWITMDINALEVRPVTFICRPDTQGDWYILQWFDREEQK